MSNPTVILSVRVQSQVADANLGTVLKKLVLIRKIMAASWAAGFPADGILLNPADWAAIEIDLLTTAAGQTLYSVSEGGQARLFGVPVIQSTGMTADNVAVGAFAQAYMIHNREGVGTKLAKRACGLGAVKPQTQRAAISASAR